MEADDLLSEYESISNNLDRNYIAAFEAIDHADTKDEMTDANFQKLHNCLNKEVMYFVHFFTSCVIHLFFSSFLFCKIFVKFVE